MKLVSPVYILGPVLRNSGFAATLSDYYTVAHLS